MRRSLLLLCAVIAGQSLAARSPAVRFDLPCRIVQGKYVVTVGTPAGPRRFIFDTGASRTTVSERLCRESGLTAEGRSLTGDFEGYSERIAAARMPELRMGEAVFRNWPIDVLPDSSYVWCLGVDGIVGSDLLQRFVVRFPAADSVLSLAGDYRQFGDLDRKRAVRLYREKGRPFVAFRVGDGRQRMEFYALFDSGAANWFSCRYYECLELIDRGLLRGVRRTSGHPGRMGWTNRSSVREAVRGTIPRIDIAGCVLTDMPLEETYGSTHKLGCGLLRRGEVVIDYPGRRFWLLPHAVQPESADVAVRNVSVAIAGGHLVVGQVWDEALADIVSPGDRIVRIGSLDVSEVDPCAVIRGEIRGDKPEMTVLRADGTRVVVPVKNL
ncbi:MAG: retroviral-like aspartic protease family protein [Alistipes sp.]|nr:retroviral-like aspartic protease family protein [Alistipes sp.]